MPEPRNAREELLQRGRNRLTASETKALVRDVLAWFVGEIPQASSEKIDQWVTEFLVHRANRAMDEGVPRYVPVDGHDWHENAGGVTESPVVTSRNDRAPGAQEGPIAPTR